jgi:membrane associated rhomboid family serine protease
MIPLKDDLPTRTFPFVTLVLIAANILIFFYEISLGPRSERFLFTWGAIPFNLVYGIESGKSPIPIVATLFTSMFLHGGFMHVAGNMLYLWIFGNNIEDVMGHVRFIFFYLICGIAAVYSHALLDSTSQVPMIGASGAVSGVLGAYLLLFPHAKVLTLIPIFFFIQIVRVPAVLILGFWFVIQIVNGVFSPRQGGGVAWFAHVGGFLVGMGLIHLFKKSKGRPWRSS